MLKQAAGVDFYNTSEFTMHGLLSDADGFRENLTKYVTCFSREITDIFDKFKTFDVIKGLDDNDLTQPNRIVKVCDPCAGTGGALTGFAGRFGAGLPRISDGQLLFVQHMVAKMRKSLGSKRNELSDAQMVALVMNFLALGEGR